MTNKAKLNEIIEKELAPKGSKKGWLTTDEVSEVLVTEADASKAEVENAYDELAKKNILVIGEEDEGGLIVEQELNYSDDSIKSYLQRIGSTKLLTADEEKELARKIAKGDDEAKKKLIEANLRLVVSVAKRYTNTSQELPDLIQQGNMGLITAVDKFDPEKGFRFSTYAIWWIRQSITREKHDLSYPVHIPGYVRDAMTKIKNCTARLHQQNEREPSLEEIAWETGFELKLVKLCQGLMIAAQSLDEPVSNSDSDGATLGSTLRDPNASSADDLAEIESLRTILESAIETLDPREQAVIRLRYGLGESRDALSQVEVAMRFGVSRERIRQVEESALKKLRKPQNIKKLRSFS
jgi:RNA polymerase primary sigma factor